MNTSLKNINISLVLFIAAAYMLAGCNKKQTLFQKLSASKTNITFKNDLPQGDKLNILYFLYYYEGGGVATGDVTNDGLPDIYFTANTPGNNKLYINKGNFQFEDATLKAGVAGTADWNSGVTFADVNADGWLDIYVCCVSEKLSLKGNNQLFINNKNGTFTESAALYGLLFSTYAVQSAFFDYDHDGDLDCYLLNQSDRPNQNIVDTSNRRKFDAHSGDKLLRNDFNTDAKKFTDVSAAAGIYQSNLGYGLGLAIADLNNDGWDDVYVGNDFHENDYYYVNNGNGTFSESSAGHFNHYSRFSMGNDVADYNNDGQLDIITVDMLPPDEKIIKTYGSDENPSIYNFKTINKGFQHQYSKNCLQTNNGSGISFSENALQSGVAATDWSWAPLFADFDNDGNKDLFITSGIVKRTTDLDYVKFISNAYVQKQLDNSSSLDEEALSKMPDGISHSFVYKGSGDISFTDKSEEWGLTENKGYFNGAAYADLDNDGDLDMVVNSINAVASVYKNNNSGNNYVAVKCKGSNANTFGYGAKVWLFHHNKIQYQQVMATRGFQSASDTKLHFGLDSLTETDSLLVVWPTQQYQVIKNIKAGRQILLEEKNAAGIFSYNNFFPAQAPVFTVSIANWQHKENSFSDFNVQYLIPHMQSTRGPKIAVADANKDGLDDIFICGAKGQASTLMLQTQAGQFIAADTAVFAATKTNDAVDAIFFDSNNDGYNDLYVVTGGNEDRDGSPALADHFFINNGNGHFTEKQEAIPQLLVNKSCVAAADVNKDGFTDLFVGGLTNAVKYGDPGNGYLLINDGNGNFKQAAANIFNGDKAGIITTASFTDFDNDGWPDLAITGEWMPLKIYSNNQGVFTEKSIAASEGLWQSLFAADVNNDGYTDLLAGNWGLNNKLVAGKTGPVKMYVKDFDKNGTAEQIVCYTINNEEFTFLCKDELEQALPTLKKGYLTYGEVAGKTVQYLFYNLFEDYATYKAVTLASSCFINDGKGNFTIQVLPPSLQQSPIFCFTAVTNGTEKNYMAAGNFYGVVPYEGRYDGLYPSVFNYSSTTKAFTVSSTMPGINGEVREAAWIKTTNNQQLLAMAVNNSNLIFLKQYK